MTSSLAPITPADREKARELLAASPMIAFENYGEGWTRFDSRHWPAIKAAIDAVQSYEARVVELEAANEKLRFDFRLIREQQKDDFARAEAAEARVVELEAALRSAEGLRDAHFAEIKRAQGIIDKLAAEREVRLTAPKLQVSAEAIQLILVEDARIVDGRIDNAPYLAVKIAEAAEARVVELEAALKAAEAEIDWLKRDNAIFRASNQANQELASKFGSDNIKLMMGEEAAEARATALLEALRELVGAVIAQVNDTGGGGYLLARLSDARAAIAKHGAPNDRQ